MLNNRTELSHLLDDELSRIFIFLSNTVNRPILLITRMITDRNGVHLVLLPLCLTEVHPLFFHTKLCAFFHDLIKSLSLYIHRGPQRPQIARALQTRAILILFNNWSKCFISR